MGTTTLLNLRDRLQEVLGDDNQVYADKYTPAIKNSIREVYPNLFRYLENRVLITGNILPNSHFEDWEDYELGVSDYPDQYKVSTDAVAIADTSTIRGGAKSAKVTASDTNQYIYITSDDYPRLLDLMGKTINFKAWANPQTANDATIEIYTVKADGTTEQTLTSTTACPADEFTLLELENQVINNDIVEIQFRFKVATNTKYAYFDAARVTGRDLYEYLLPQELQEGRFCQVYIQLSGYSDDVCDDILPRTWERVYGTQVINDGSYRYLRLPALFTSCRQIRIIGIAPLEELTADTSTISLSGEKVNLLVTYAAYLVHEMTEAVPASEDTSKYERASAKWWSKYTRILQRHRMIPPSATLNIPFINE